jgi:4-hydroxybenzoate polyprenyltransferase
MFKNFPLYIKDRFPVLPLTVYSLLSAVAVSSEFRSYAAGKIIPVTVIYVLFLFHLRVLDEFKDYKYDSKFHGDRPVQKGLVSLKTVGYLGLFNFSLMAVLAYLISAPWVMTIFIFTIAYTGLMYREFFISAYLRNNPVLYLVSHEIVTLPLFMFFFSAFSHSVWFPDTVGKLSVLLYAVAPMALIEIGRKLKHRYDTHGKITNDTYAYWWGETNSIRIFAALLASAGILGLFINNYHPVFSGIIFLLSAVIFFGSSHFPEIIIRNHMAVTTVSALMLPVFLIFRID